MRHWRHKLEEQILLFLGFLLRSLPRSVSLALGEALGNLVFLAGIRRKVAIENLSRAFPQWSGSRVRDTAERCYRHFGALLAEFSRLPLLNKSVLEELVEFEGMEVLDQARAQGRGGIVVSGHLGNWELMGASVAVSGYPVAYVVTGQENQLVEHLMDQLRQSTGAHIIKRHEAAKAILKALHANQIVAMLSDQDAHEAGAFVPFFGRLASTPRGAAIFSLRSGAPIIFVESYRQRKGKLRIILELLDQKDLPGNREGAAFELTRRFTARLEEAIRRHPEQWFWMHRRWKSTPE